MPSIGLKIVLSIVIIFIIMMLVIFQSNLLSKLLIGSRHADLQEILRTNKPPERWIKGIYRSASIRKI
jgi:hypothetical protein